MTIARSRFGLPLFTRELIELSNRSRTYLLRIAYAVLLFLAAYLRFYDILSSGGGRFAILGHGRRMFETLVVLQFAGIYLFMPAVGCSAFTQEKERNTLGLLFLTRLGPTTILFEKLCSRLVPMFGFLLLAMPLLAFTFSLGGVTEFQLWSSIWVLALTAVQVASITLMCSAYCTSTITAFITSYWLSLGSLFFCSCCGIAFTSVDGSFLVGNIGQLITSTFLLGISIVVFLVLARGYLTSRAFVVPNNLLFDSFRRLDHFYVNVHESTGKVTIVRRIGSLPTNAPVAWRETTKSLLGSSGNLIRLVSVIEVPLILLLTMTMGLSHGAGQNYVFILIEITLWVVAILLLVVTTTGVIPRERDRQTLEALLTTPLSGREILLQKLSAIRRIVLSLWIAFGTILLFLCWLWVERGFKSDDGLHLATTLLSALIYLPLIVWLSFWISLRVKSQGRAILISMAVIVVWIVLPAVVLSPYYSHVSPVLRFSLMLAGPSVVFLPEQAHGATTALIAFHFPIYGGLLAFIRHILLKRADKYLGRLGDPPSQLRAVVPERL
jgi:hypothetical protein